jgi:hypothetical protein
MPNAAKKQLPPETFPAEEIDDEFGSLEDMAALMVDAFTMPMASDLQDRQVEDDAEAEPLPAKPPN